MKLCNSLLAVAAAALAAGCSDDPSGPSDENSMSFFVSSATSPTGNLGGLGGADARCQVSSWNSSHTNQSCADTTPRGGAGRIYCFAIN